MGTKEGGQKTAALLPIRKAVKACAIQHDLTPAELEPLGICSNNAMKCIHCANIADSPTKSLCWPHHYASRSVYITLQEDN